jgi:glycosyltransferase involved in cell wall biosynthesis
MVPAITRGSLVTLSVDHRIVTIAARNYLPRAAVLARSYRAVHPDRKLTILLVDGEDGAIPSSEDFDIATGSDLALAADEFRRMAMIYGVTEFCTSLKPWALEMLLHAGGDVATYLDPDIEVFAPLDELAEAAVNHTVALTPHTIEPFPRDGLQPTESDIMQAGAFNLGYVSVSKDAAAMIDWWKERLQRHSVVAPEKGFFVDQRWIDLLPGYFRHAIIRDPGYNVAYWNLHERRLTRDGDQIRVNEQPLRFFHYSGYQLDLPGILNKYYAARPRVLMSEHPTVFELCERYRSKVLATEETFEVFIKPYGFGVLRDGTPVAETLRTIYRDAVIEAEDKGDPSPPVPFVGDDSELIDWLRSPAREGSRISHFLMGLWGARPDLRAAFPDPLGQHESNLRGWAIQAIGGSDPALAACGGLWKTPPPAIPDPLSDAPGVNISGYFEAELGVGEAGRLVIEAVRASGLPFRTVLSRQTLSRQNAEFSGSKSQVRYPVSVAVVNADAFPQWAHTIGCDLIADTYVIGQWAWELEDFPECSAALALVDEIWAYSEFGRAAVAKKTNKPVYIVPCPIKEPKIGSRLDRRAIGIPDGPYFLFAFDYFSVFERKNPLGLVDAFRRAFPDGGGPHLVIKSVNGERRAKERDVLRLACLGRSDIHLVEGYLDSGQVSALMHEATAYVSLHRSEGLGLTMAEAMSHGKPVIATAYSGNLDFMSTDDSLLVPFRLVSVTAGNDPYPTSAFWAEPDVAAAADHMRWVAAHPAEAADLGERARRVILTERSAERAAAFVHDRVADIVNSGAHMTKRTLGANGHGGAGKGGTPAARALELINTAPDVTSASNHPLLAKGFRQLVYRVLAHHDTRANTQMTAIVEAVSEADQQSKRADKEILESVDRQASLVSNQVAQLDVRHREGLKKTAEILGRLRALEDAAVATRKALDARLIDLHTTVAQIDTEMVARPYTAVEDAGIFVEDGAGRVMGYQPGTASIASYADFEDTYRGSEDYVSAALKPYLPILVDRGPVLDIGCGRGELLELLRSAGIPAFGVDLDESMRDRCLQKGLDVRSGDGIETLGSGDDGSLGAVVSIQVVEHLQPGDVRRMFELAHSALRRDGILLAETVNPHSPPALKAFWLDLTHVRPLYPESLLMLAQQCGFESARIVFPSSTGNLDQDLRLSGSYALVATKCG